MTAHATSDATARRSSSAAGRAAVVTGTLSVLLIAGTALIGPSAAVPPAGPRTWAPPWNLTLHPSSALVTGLLWVAAAFGAACVALGLRAHAAGARPRARRVAAAALVAVALLVAVPPLGSADHLSYVAYGRIAAQGDDPYTVIPRTWRGGTDPVAGAVRPPWQDTPSVYGPVATGVMAAASLVAGSSLRLTIWLWQLVCAASFLAVALLLDRAARGDPAVRARAAVLWTLNPLLLWQLVLGAHVDVLAAALALGALVAGARRPLLAGVLLGAATGTKAPSALVALGLLWGLREMPRAAGVRAALLGLAGALAVLVPSHLAAGPHVFDQLRTASRFTSIASPWRALANLADLLVAPGALRPYVTGLALALGLGLGVLLVRRRLLPAAHASPESPDLGVPRPVAAVAVAMAAGWLLTAPYALPWYAALAWAPLALVPATFLDQALLAQLSVLTVAYVPGLVTGLDPGVQTVTLALRRYLAPLLLAAVVVAVVGWCLLPRSGGGLPASRTTDADRPRPA
ncbi:MAG TPA: polyprenol phosphomannose-dependent alpha 1,6 mannosyltransferase MptB [Kineosporiaceae bacterium]|nr:polyprenol phosphomannose-dependent alpha 1,6 mannosyltransferase MptB [Kineosporiaceae bacterium]